MTQTSRTLSTVELDNCANEPIRIPGSVQPHGFLLVLDRVSLAVVQTSTSIETHLGMKAEAVIGRSLAELMQRDTATLAVELEQLTAGSLTPHHLSTSLRHADGALYEFDMVIHAIGNLLMAEFEPAAVRMLGAAAMYPSLISFVTQLQQARTTDAVCELAVAEVKRVTGFGRVTAYAFDEEGHGRVNAERVDRGYDAFLGLQFPASDIPAQARELYVLNRIRVIPDAMYTPSRLVPPEWPAGGPTDLSNVALRSVSPVHLEYMRNMGTMASMSISIVVEGRLWGMISCHNTDPLTVPVQTRVACDLLGKMVSLQVEAREAHADTERRLELRQLLVRMLSSMADHDSVARGLYHMPETFLNFAQAAGAAIVSGDECLTFGETPDRMTIKALCTYIASQPERDVFHTDRLTLIEPDFEPIIEDASGVLAVSISELHANFILWFRPQQLRTIEWAGAPTKQDVKEENGTLRLHPRKSFQSWQQEVRGQSRRWDRAVVDAAAELRAAVLGIVLRKAEELADMANELDRTNKELEAFSYSVSHDLRAPLRHIAGYAELLDEYEGGKLSEKGVRFLSNIGDSARFAGNLVDSLLTFSQMGRNALRPSNVDLTPVIDQIVREFQPDIQHRNIEWVIHPMPRTYGDAAYLHLALRNLISNAIKYTRKRDDARVEIGAMQGDGETVFYVKDNGVGFDMKYTPKLFGVFQRLHRMEDFEGTGIGLANVRRIVERHGGRVWAEAEIDKGATFYVALPDPGSAAAATRTQKRG
ncbi:ATP-binding protein [Pigmentiphaga litoralis]|uniref:histidine kinase n=1 Tax=Pigmentiphaga litoralis TaxID=516702 RepID=A0A7Y9LPK4_9BURK|nr:light-regulated signal transduction histidine kinase (bacteriophytochrome) [Pigmentiphaga litoralis]NYE84570.1 light-regulated signal transduction histidine kinase (bacteriophytochrome) [Pigmentiphaga litoralis]